MKKKQLLGLSSVVMLAFVVCGMFLFNTASAKAASAKTGVGLSEHALNAYNEGWKYSYGSYGQLHNGVRSSDCSGLIKSYLWWTGNNSNPNPALFSVSGSSTSMLESASEKGNIVLSDSSTLPRIHGLVLYSPHHVGVYVGNNMSVDNRCTGQNVKHQKVIGGKYHWTMWFKLPQIEYPNTGFETFEGNKYYYENGQYVVNTTKTINGESYTFNSSGALVSSSVNIADITDISASSVSYKTLQKKSRGNDVLELQNKLVACGYMHENPTGYYGDVTKAAVSDYQKAAGLNITGIADINTQTKLYTATANT